MANITIEQVQDFLKTNDFDCLSSQKKLCFPIIRRISHKMTLGVPFDEINVHEDVIINGHHRYICAQLMKQNIGRHKSGSPTHLNHIAWENVILDAVDWESQDIIERHNRRDALNSGIPIPSLEI